jgi:hypothetical protein
MHHRCRPFKDSLIFADGCTTFPWHETTENVKKNTKKPKKIQKQLKNKKKG